MKTQHFQPKQFAGAKIIVISLSLAMAGLFSSPVLLHGQEQTNYYMEGKHAFLDGDYDKAIAAHSRGATNVRAQSADDELLAVCRDDEFSYDRLYKTTDGHLIFTHSNSKSKMPVTEFIYRFTVSLNAVTSITMTTDERNRMISILVSTQENAVLTEKTLSDGSIQKYQQSFVGRSKGISFDLSEKAKADSVMAELKQLTGK